MDNTLANPAETAQARRSAWVAPRIDRLPPLTELVLQTGAPIPGLGQTGGGGTTVF